MPLFLAAAVAAVVLQNAPDVIAEESAACPVVSRPASIARAVIPIYPDVAENQGASGTAVVAIDLSSNGDVLAIHLQKSSGNRSLDLAALKTAASMEYAPEVRACEPISGTYSVEVDFPS